MKNVILIIVFSITCFSCKNEIKKVESKKEVEPKKSELTLNDYLDSGLEDLENFEDLNFFLTGDVFIKGLAFYEKKPNNYALVLMLQDEITTSIVQKYTFGVEAFVYDEDLDKLSSYSKSKKRKHEAWYFKPQLVSVNENKYVVYDLNTTITDFKKLVFYVYDRESYKGVIGRKKEFGEYTIK